MAGDLGPDPGIDYSQIQQPQAANARLPFWDALGENIAQEWDNSTLGGGGIIGKSLGYLQAEFTDVPDTGIDADYLNKQYADLGLKFTPDMSVGMVNFQIKQRLEEIKRQASQQDYPSGFLFGATRLATSLGVQATDPLNLAAAAVPVVGEARYGLWAERYGATVARMMRGAAAGGVGTAALQPFQAIQAHETQDEFTAWDAFTNTAFGSVLGGGLHAGLGKLSDILTRAAPETREAALRSSVAQTLEGRNVDVGAVLATDPVTANIPEAAKAYQPSAEELDGALQDVKFARSAAPQEQSLLGMIRALGGLKVRTPAGELTSEGGDLRSIIDNPGIWARIVNNTREGTGKVHGNSFEDMIIQLKSEGWLPPDADINDLHDLIRQEVSGRKVYHPESNIHQDLAYRDLVDEEFNRASITDTDSNAEAARKLAEYRVTAPQHPVFDAGQFSPDEEDVLGSVGYGQGAVSRSGLEGQDAGEAPFGAPESQGPVAGGGAAQSPVAQAALESARLKSRDFAAGQERSSAEPTPEAVARAEADLKAGDDPEAELQDAMQRLQAYRSQGIISDAEWASLETANSADSEAAKMDGDAAQAAATCLFLHP